jgi:5'(3')-deoxyribonucleotidase
MKQKEQIGADIYIEDSPANVEALREKCLETICFANTTNTHTIPPRANSWEEVYQLIHQRFASEGAG